MFSTIRSWSQGWNRVESGHA